MELVAVSQAMQQWSAQAARPLIFVPTMGALHQGHAALLRSARSQAGIDGSVVVSVFVNPRQFGPHEDLERYPRTLATDRALCESEGVDLLFHPSSEEIYASDASVTIQEQHLSHRLCGLSRPGHFSGVMTVVAKLFNLVSPNIAIFGEKDWQQLAIIRRMVRDLNFLIEVQAHPIVREEDGLAMSSRNAYLALEERMMAPLIYQTLQTVAAEVAVGEKSVNTLLRSAREALEAIPGAMIDYVEIMNEETLEPLSGIISRESKARLLVALKLGTTRLIDNIALHSL
jgi:pantoate--beta-alanine ligase